MKTRYYSVVLNYRPFFSDNTNLVVGTADGEVYIWGLESFTLITKYQMCSSGISSLNYSPDGVKLALGLKNNNLEIIDVGTGLSVFSKAIKSCISSMKWKSSFLIFGCEDGSIFLWNIVEVKLLRKIDEAHQGK